MRLADGEFVNSLLPKEAVTITFGIPEAADGETASYSAFGSASYNSLESASTEVFDLSENQDGSILAQFDCNTKALLISAVDGNRIIANKNCKGMFSGMKQLQSIDARGLSTHEVESFESAFEGCASLESADFSTWNTRSLESAKDMLLGCDSLRTLELGPGWSIPSDSGKQALFPASMSSEEADYSAGSPIPPGRASYRGTGSQESSSASCSGLATENPADAEDLQ